MIRKFEFIGKITKDRIRINGDENIYLIADGLCNLKGKILVKNKTVEVWVNGKNNLKFTGKCNKIIIRNVYEKSRIDMGNLICKEASVDRADGNSIIILSVLERLKRAYLSGETLLYLNTNPRIDNLSLLGKSKIEHKIEIK
jgi:hypothetical protein